MGVWSVFRRADGAELIGGPRLEDSTRKDMQLRRFRAQAKRAARETTHYHDLFSTLDIDPRLFRCTCNPLTTERK
jgi:hypothetical protein